MVMEAPAPWIVRLLRESTLTVSLYVPAVARMVSPFAAKSTPSCIPPAVYPGGAFGLTAYAVGIARWKPRAGDVSVPSYSQGL